MFSHAKPIRPQKLHEQVTERLRDMILERQLQPGDQLPSERELQAMFAIGRPAVREALLLLERSGLVALRSGSPATVTSAAPENIIRAMRAAVDHFLAGSEGVREIQAARKLLECSLARQAARQRSEADLERMASTIERSKAVLDDTEAFEALDLEFHSAIVNISGIRVFGVMFQALSDWMREQRLTTLSTPGHADIALAYHVEIYNGIAAADADAAERAMQEHLQHVEKVYWAAKQVALRRMSGAAG